LKENKMAMLGLYTIIFIILLAVFGPIFSKYSYSDQLLDKQGLLPNREFWFGTDTLGRDMFVRVLYGARISLAVGFVASFINLTLGVLYGGISGLLGGRVDNIMMRIVDIFYSVPLVLYVILLMVVVGAGLKSIFIALGAVYWLEMARIVRAQVLSLKEQEFILAARTLGANNLRILLRHLIPNCMGPIIITVTNSIPRAIFTEAFLSFIGLGVSAPAASWGMLASDAVPGIRSYPHVLFFPALAISITMLAFNFLGDGLRDALDPRLRK
jgi:oligopeptide transport system permease protein